ncbi:MAG: EAL domain-containing protein [Candidatus Thiodiazotropha sp.]
MTHKDLNRLSREFKAISRCNQAVIHARDESVLLHQVCEVLCQVLNYPMAWVVFPGGESENLWTVAACAGNPGIQDVCNQFLDVEMRLGEGPLRPYASNPAERTTEAADGTGIAESWRLFEEQHELRASILLPIRDRQEQLIGWLQVFSNDYRVFSAEERQLIEQFTEDLSFGIQHLRLNQAHQQAEQDLLSNLRFFRDMDRVNRAIQKGGDLHQMVNDTLEILLQIFACDRAYLLFPCDPDAASWKASLERTRPEYPGMAALGVEVDMTPEVAASFRIILNADEPVQFGADATYPIPEEVAERFELKAVMAMALYPRVGKPWQFGIHQCASDRVWNDVEVRLFKEVGARLTDGLSSMLTLDDLRENRRKLAESENQFHTLVDNLPDCIARFDRQGQVIFVNKASLETFDLSERDMLGHSLSGGGPGNAQDNTLLGDMIQRVFEEGTINVVETTWQTRAGVRTFEVMHLPECDAEGRVLSVLGVGHDVTDSKEQQKQLLYQAHYDQLTGLPNRFLALDRLEQNIKIAERGGLQTALIFLDLDDFKKINDGLGHEVGDRVLKLSADRLKKAVRDSDTVARLGGDEFIVLVQDVKQPGSVRAVSDKILQAFQEVFEVMDRRIMVTASLGIAVYPVDGADAFSLLRNADTAMYYSKVMGRNACHFFTESMNQNVSRRLLMEEQLRQALERDEMYMAYQPIMTLDNGQLVGVEALLRWENDLLGQLPTQEVIDIAEQTGLIIPIGHWVIKTVLKDLHGWKLSADMPFRVSLNISPRQFRNAEFLPILEATLLKEGVSGHNLQLEITEGLLLAGEVGVGEVIEHLHEMGIYLAMDDFGTGYSSLSYLRKYRFDTIKIDREFISNLLLDANDRVMVTAILRMARGLGVKVVAEGVETREQLDFLREEVCDYAQGYLFGEPVESLAIKTLLGRQDVMANSD